MRKIDLDTDVMWWYEGAIEKHGAVFAPEQIRKVREMLFAMPFMRDDPTMRCLCESAMCDFFDSDLADVLFLLRLLGKYGLRLEMSKEELDEYEGKTAPKADTIDWEQRRWELAKEMGKSADLLPCNTISYVDKFIEVYKQTLNKEEQL